MARSRQEKFRLGILLVITTVVFAIIALRLVHLQVFLSPEYSKQVDIQSSRKIPIPANRGVLYDRNGNIVVNNIRLSSIYCNPKDKKELNQSAAYLEKLLNLPKGSAIKDLKLGVNRFRWIDRQIDDKLADHIAKTAPGGIYLRNEVQRDYPFGSIGKQILGFTNIDCRGQSGFEYAYDSVMAGQPGYADYRRDGLQNIYRVREKALVKPVPGKSMLLSIDWALQEIVEEELRIGVGKYNAQSAMAVFVNNNNGEILAMAHFDPDEKNPDKPMKLRPVTDQLEPGSIFKILTAVGVLDEELVNFQDTIWCDTGKWKVDGRILHDDKKHGWLNFRQIIELSSNVGIGKYCLELGGDNLYERIKQFGIGQKPGLNWPGEARGRIYKPEKWSDYTVASLSMGHAVAVSPLQMTMAVAAIANGGKLYQPRIIIGEVDEKGNVINKTEPVMLSEIAKSKTCDSLRAFMRGVVERGTAEKAQSNLVAVAGKTGTAQIPKKDGRGYEWGKFNASFAGFFPAENPLITGLVIYENPQPVHYGGWTSGPTFTRIAERYTNLNPDLFTVSDRLIAENSDKFENTRVIPELLGYEYEQALTLAKEHGFDLRANMNEGNVIWQFPSPDRLAFENDVIIVAMQNKDNEIRMADLKGLSIREVSAFLQLAGINYKVKGNGRVVSQSVKPGEILKKDVTCRLECKPI